ncbi:loricrin-like [Asparagus officinalis]|uniref:loricrin-like n=1 Tax=Asparagus officinalis TaxID=4686 RepID=UPI00098E600B|nr:loricrin-like [Asparagus officinalis]
MRVANGVGSGEEVGDAVQRARCCGGCSGGRGYSRRRGGGKGMMMMAASSGRSSEKGGATNRGGVAGRRRAQAAATCSGGGCRSRSEVRPTGDGSRSEGARRGEVARTRRWAWGRLVSGGRRRGGGALEAAEVKAVAQGVSSSSEAERVVEVGERSMVEVRVMGGGRETREREKSGGGRGAGGGHGGGSAGG